MKIITIALLIFVASVVSAQLSVTVSPPKVIGQKAIVTLEMKNDFSENIKSARASCFLLNDQGVMIAQSAKWVINSNQNKAGLVAGGTNEFNFVITSSQPFTTTNLTAKVNFSRVVMESGKLADLNKVVQQNAQQKLQ
jgi:hypothetical protein